MASVVCPFCYQGIDPSQLWYQCLGRNGTCKKAVDPERLRLTKSTLETFQSFAFERHVSNKRCPWCQGKTGMRACPACRMAIFDSSSGQALTYTACPFCRTRLVPFLTATTLGLLGASTLS